MEAVALNTYESCAEETRDHNHYMTSSKAIKIDGDMISRLPDELLHHVFSFLDMKFVMQTDVLSKRWRNLWKSMSILNFNEDEYFRHLISVGAIENRSRKKYPFGETDDVTNFVNLVNGVLSSLDETTHLLTLSLFCRYSYFEAGFLEKWAQVAVKHNLVELDLRLHLVEGRIFVLPQCFFNCESVTTLKLGSEGAMMYFNLNVSKGLPALRTLHLKSIKFYGGEGTDNFFSRCPVLETLIISKCRRVDAKNLTISSLQLKNLKMGITWSDGIRPFPFEVFSKIKMTVSAPSLITFMSSDYMFNEYYLVKTSLERADLDMAAYEIYFYNISDSGHLTFLNEEHSQNALRVLKEIGNVRSLKISGLLLQAVNEVPGGIGNLLTPFPNLRYLKLRTSLSLLQIRAVSYLLEKVPSLDTLVLEVTKRYLHRFKDQKRINPPNRVKCWEAEFPLQFTMHHLKFLEIGRVEGSANELEFLKFLLKNAPVLEKVIVSTKKFPSMEKKVQKFTEKLVTVPRASSNVSMSFC